MTDKVQQKAGSLLTGERPLPHNAETERTVLSAILQEPKLAAISIAYLKDSSSFFVPQNRAVYQAIYDLEMASKALDVITVDEQLQRSGDDRLIGGIAYLYELQGVAPTLANFEYHLEILRELASLRRMIDMCANVEKDCRERDKEASSILNEIAVTVGEIQENIVKDSIVGVADLVHPVMEEIFHSDGGAVGLASGYPSLDEKSNGLKKGEMIVLAARPSIGKTTFALNLAANIAMHTYDDKGELKPVSVGIFSLEMTSDQLVRRLIFSEAELNERDVMQAHKATAEEYSLIGKAAARIKAAPIYIDDTPQIDVLEMQVKARRMKERYGIEVLMIDYLQLIRGRSTNKNASREQEVAQISAAIKGVAKELSIPVVVLAQLNRQAEEEKGLPKVSQLRESGSIEQDADIVMILHRDRNKQIAGTATVDSDGNQIEDKQRKREADEHGYITSLVIAKNRNGETGLINLLFKPTYTKFLELDPHSGYKDFTGD